MKWYLFVVLSLMLFGCGNNVTDAPDNTDELLVGMWDSVSNTSADCHERIKFNGDHTFWWFDKKVLDSGTYGREEDRLNFMFTNKAWENIKFFLTNRELYLTRVGKTLVYTKVPLSTSNISPCPDETKSKMLTFK